MIQFSKLHRIFRVMYIEIQDKWQIFCKNEEKSYWTCRRPSTHFSRYIHISTIDKYLPSARKAGFSKNSINCSTSRSKSTFGKSGIIWETTLNPASLDIVKLSQTALTVCPLGELIKFSVFMKNIFNEMYHYV